MPTIEIKSASMKFTVDGGKTWHTYTAAHDVAIVTIRGKKTYIVPHHLGYEGEDGTLLTLLTEKEFLQDWSFVIID